MNPVIAFVIQIVCVVTMIGCIVLQGNEIVDLKAENGRLYAELAHANQIILAGQESCAAQINAIREAHRVREAQSATLGTFSGLSDDEFVRSARGLFCKDGDAASDNAACISAGTVSGTSSSGQHEERNNNSTVRDGND